MTESGAIKVKLTKGYHATVDIADADVVAAFTWQAVVTGRRVYAATTVCAPGRKQYRLYMHRLLLSAPAGMEVDHVNGDGLDNRRRNIRLATGAENRRNKGLTAQNRSGLKGASWNNHAGKWEANIRAGGKRHYLGLFLTAETAHAAYAEAALRLHGAFARCA